MRDWSLLNTRRDATGRIKRNKKGREKREGKMSGDYSSRPRFPRSGNVRKLGGGKEKRWGQQLVLSRWPDHFGKVTIELGDHEA